MNVSDLTTFWFQNPNYWFDASSEDDALISARFGDLLADRFDREERVPLPNESLAYILLYDQIARHVCRVNGSCHKPYFERAFHIAMPIIENRALLESYAPEERVFILLVYRHTFEIPYIQRVISMIEEWRSVDHHPLYRRFYQASMNSLGKLKNIQNLLYAPRKEEYSYDEMDGILDEKQSPKMADFFAYDYTSDLEALYQDELYQTFESNLLPFVGKVSQMGVSLSGGVDSMVCAFLLYLFCRKHSSAPIAFSVNYANRTEQTVELYMVNQVLSHWNADYTHYVRTIDEIKRTQDENREFYESYTRNVRFSCYQQVAKGLNVPFLLGHNRDDSLENVISNIKKGRSYSNLLGMSPVGVEKEVTLLRPLLSVWKRDIVAFAQKYKIPFVYDSTPSWSERGQMRDTLFPFLNQFDPRILDGLYNLAINYKEIYKVYESSLPLITFEEKMCVVEDKEIYFEDYMKRILQKVVSHYGLYPIRNKSIRHMIHMLQFNKSAQKITLSKQLICQKVETNLLFYIV